MPLIGTLAALAAFAAFLQERALKTKKPTAFTRQLPSVADAEHLVVRLLTVVLDPQQEASRLVIGIS